MMRQESPSVKCPVCNYVHADGQQPNQGGGTTGKFQPHVQHACSHGAKVLFTKLEECPVCMDEVGPPVVSLPCGHVVCEDDFERIGGRIGEAASMAPEPANPGHRGLFDFMQGSLDLNDSESSSDNMPALAHRDQNLHAPDDDLNESAASYSESSSANMPALAHRDQNLHAPDDDSDDDTSVPILVPRTTRTGGGSSSDDSSTAPAWNPSLVDANPTPPRPLAAVETRRNDDDQEEEDDDDSVPALWVHQGDEEYTSGDDDDESVPPLERPQENDSTTSGDDYDDDDSGPPLLVARGRPHLVAVAPRQQAPPSPVQRAADREEARRRQLEAAERRRQEEIERQRRQQEEEELQRQRRREQEQLRRAEKRRKQKARRKIFTFLQAQWYRKVAQRRFQLCRESVMKLQAVSRGSQTRKEWGERVKIRLELARRYSNIWKPCMERADAMMHDSSEGEPINSWLSLSSLLESKMPDDYIIPGDEEEAINKILEEAAEKALGADELLAEEDVAELQEEEEEETVPTDCKIDVSASASSASATAALFNDDVLFTGTHTSIMYTDTVMKWLKTRAGGTYRGLFVKRIQQLSRGERSRILAKRLKGCKNPIYETYLEQKSGKRILWTIEGTNLLVWYVANHDNVSRLMRLIDDSQNRSQRQLVSASSLIHQTENHGGSSENQQVQIVLNPFGNTPMKVYEVALNDVGEVASGSWIPRLKLTDEERDVVESRGTVLLLGRSGTGKTICTANRMDYDRQLMAHDPSFSQLFVARSKPLCTYVKNAIGSTENESFITYDELKNQLEDQLPKVAGVRDHFPEELEMQFYRFKKELCEKDQSTVDPLLVWTSIRSFIKGSIEATSGTAGALTRDQFLDFQLFGPKRCRLTLEQRQFVYQVYQRYAKYMQEKGMWDECDRIVALLTRLEDCKTSDPDLYQNIKKSKVYVDEVQDYTQAECLLFFYLCSGQGNLFLAGDPAQNVEEGVEFRFEDIRSVEYHIARDRNTVMEKPKVVNVNFRSHAGILNTAGAILSCMFGAFPNSAKQLKEDRGIFAGPRPEVFEKMEIDVLRDLLTTKLNGAVVLVHSSTLKFWRNALPRYGLIRSIEASKGLEFRSVILLDFFSDLSKETSVGVQKAWRDLLLRGGFDDVDKMFPEIEGQLKRLYTGVTRCIERLYFVETKETEAGSAFVRWLTTTTTARNKKTTEVGTESGKLASKVKIIDLENKVMTKDEALKSGLDMAVAAEARGRSDLTASIEDLNQAVYYFELAQEEGYRAKARVHLESIGLKSNLPPIPRTRVQETETLEGEFEELETGAARIVERLLKESLLQEARDLCITMLPYLSGFARERLKKDLRVSFKV